MAQNSSVGNSRSTQEDLPGLGNSQTSETDTQSNSNIWIPINDQETDTQMSQVLANTENPSTVSTHESQRRPVRFDWFPEDEESQYQMSEILANAERTQLPDDQSQTQLETTSTTQPTAASISIPRGALMSGSVESQIKVLDNLLALKTSETVTQLPDDQSQTQLETTATTQPIVSATQPMVSSATTQPIAASVFIPRGALMSEQQRRSYKMRAHSRHPRFRRVLRDNLRGISNGSIRRLARRGGVKRMSCMMYEETRGVLKVFLENIIKDATTYTAYANRKTVTAGDIIMSLKQNGRTLYGFD
jgi:histone H4